MKLKIIVKPNAKTRRVDKLLDGTLKVLVDEPPLEGRANKAVIEVLAEYLNVPKSRIVITVG